MKYLTIKGQDVKVCGEWKCAQGSDTILAFCLQDANKGWNGTVGDGDDDW